MNSVATFFARAKHWQIFAVFMIGQLAGFVGVIAATIGVTYISKVPGLVLMLLSYLTPVLWWFSVGSLLHSTVQPTRDLHFGLFRSASIFVAFGSLTLFLGPLVPESGVRLANPIMVGIVGTSVFMLLCIFYIGYFLSKSLTVLKGKATIFNSDVGYFFLFLFYPLGVWVIQPRINQIYAET